nr:vesicle transport protein GOT1 [Ipomoea batatas]
MGIIMEVYGCIVLFGGFWPSVKVFLYQIPVIGWILRYPTLVSVFLCFYLPTFHQ